MTLAERSSRIYLTKKVFSKDAGEVGSAIISMLSGYKDVCHTITFDNGGEFSEHQAIAEALEAEMYFAHPYASHERGLNENTNGLLHQFVCEAKNGGLALHFGLESAFFFFEFCLSKMLILKCTQ